MAALPIPIGVSDQRRVRLSAKRRSTHLHVMGASGQGKSKFIEHCIREDILAGHGVCLIDPEGSLYENIVAWCALHRIDRQRTIHLFDPTEAEWRFRFNPLYVHDGEKPQHRIDNVIEALAQVWEEDSRSTPAIRTTLRAIFTVLTTEGYSLAEAFHLTTTADPYRIVEYLTHNIDNPVIREIWDGYNLTAKEARREHINEFGGSRRRLSELLGDEDIREILAAYEDPIDFRKCMDDGDIVLINLAPEAMGDDPARAFGALLVREMFYCASRRNPAEAEDKPFYAYIDECGEFLTNDIPRILARARKRGFHVILAHQWLEQLRERSLGIYHGVMGVQNKVIFGGISDEDAAILADQLFRTEYDLEVPVDVLTKPQVVGYRRTWLNSWGESWASSESETHSEAEASSATESVGEVTGEAVVQSYDTDGYPIPAFTTTSSAGESKGYATGNISSSGTASTRGHSETGNHGRSEALEPILENLVGGVHGLESVRHMAISRLRKLPVRHAVVKGPTEPSFDISTFKIDDVNVPESMVAGFKERVLQSSPFTVSAEKAREIMRLHFQALSNRAANFVPAIGLQGTIEAEESERG